MASASGVIILRSSVTMVLLMFVHVESLIIIIIVKLLQIVHMKLSEQACSLTTAPVTKQGESPLAVAVRRGKLDMIKCLVKECNANVNSESSV